MKFTFRSALVALGLFASGAAVSQIVSLPTVPTVATNDLFQIFPGGYPQPTNQYATAAQIAGVPGFTYTVPLTGFTLTFANSQSNMILNPAGTLATGTLTTAANPSNGQRECVLSTQTQTALTWAANTGQTIVNPPTALVANTPVCMTYVSTLSAWQRSP